MYKYAQNVQILKWWEIVILTILVPTLLASFVLASVYGDEVSILGLPALAFLCITLLFVLPRRIRARQQAHTHNLWILMDAMTKLGLTTGVGNGPSNTTESILFQGFRSFDILRDLAEAAQRVNALYVLYNGLMESEPVFSGQTPKQLMTTLLTLAGLSDKRSEPTWKAERRNFYYLFEMIYERRR